MTLRFLLDTNVLSEPLKKRPDPNVMRMFADHREEIATASVVWHELLFGTERLPHSRRRRTIEAYLDRVVAAAVPILPYDAAAAAWHAAERARLQAAGRAPAFADGQIAAIASVNGLVLVTENVQHFKPFAGLSVERWYS